ncbi:hypothetical protein GA0070558_15618 [Micromonospora haikouensis]|uniref:Uncharacterized protein n=1 Tax=Micromonospora haikouensis TaxID=686309 RepID=A0A1C4YMC3_9ACTN|nr:hypothetical protein GA0070558_15618 [Micromonospora haikouensis]
MNQNRPLFSADWHARRAEALTDHALSASMSGWWKRGRRRELLAAAQVHAALGAVAMHAETHAASPGQPAPASTTNVGREAYGPHVREGGG